MQNIPLRPLRFTRAVSAALKEAAKKLDERLQDRWIAPPRVSEAAKHNPAILENPILQSFASKGMEARARLQRVLNSQELQSTWAKIEDLLNGSDHETKVEAYLNLLNLLAIRIQEWKPQNETDNAREKRREGILSKVKALRRAIAEDKDMSDWTVANIAGIRYAPETAFLYDPSNPSLPRLGGFVSNLQKLIRDDAYKSGTLSMSLQDEAYRNFIHEYKLTPANETRAARQRLLCRILALHFSKYCNTVPYTVIAKLTEVTLNAGCVNPESVAKDIKRLKKAGRWPDISPKNT